jgi:hypothetical protein
MERTCCRSLEFFSKSTPTLKRRLRQKCQVKQVKTKMITKTHSLMGLTKLLLTCLMCLSGGCLVLHIH